MIDNIYNRLGIEKPDKNCLCSRKSRQFNSDPYYFASRYCPQHYYLFDYRWLNKLAYLPDNLQHRYHGRFTFHSSIKSKEISDAWEYFRRKEFGKPVGGKNIIYRWCKSIHLDYSQRFPNLHMHVLLASDTEIDASDFSATWDDALWSKTGEVSPSEVYFELQRSTWEANLRYMLWDGKAPMPSGLLPIGKHRADFAPLPRYGLFPHLVTCSRRWKECA